MATARSLFQTALAGCPNISKEMEEWDQKFDSLKTRPGWSEAATEIYHDNKAEIDEYMTNEF